MDTLHLGDRPHSPGKGVGQAVFFFYTEMCLTRHRLAVKNSHHVARRGSANFGVYNGKC